MAEPRQSRREQQASEQQQSAQQAEQAAEASRQQRAEGEVESPLSTGKKAEPKEGDLTAPTSFANPPGTGEEPETETVATYEEAAEAGFVGTKPKDKEE